MLCIYYQILILLLREIIASSPGPGSMGTHCICMHKVYGNFSSTIRHILTATIWSARLWRNKRTKIRISSVYWENNTCAHSVYQDLSPPLKGPGYEASGIIAIH